MENIQAKTGRSSEDFWKLAKKDSFVKRGKIVAKHVDMQFWLKSKEIELGHMHANFVTACLHLRSKDPKVSCLYCALLSRCKSRPFGILNGVMRHEQYLFSLEKRLGMAVISHPGYPVIPEMRNETPKKPRMIAPAGPNDTNEEVEIWKVSAH